MADFNPSNEPGTCPWCGRKLTPPEPSGYSPRHYPPFCTMRCGLAFGRAAHRLGYRLQPKEKP